MYFVYYMHINIYNPVLIGLTYVTLTDIPSISSISSISVCLFVCLFVCYQLVDNFSITSITSF